MIPGHANPLSLIAVAPHVLILGPVVVIAGIGALLVPGPFAVLATVRTPPATLRPYRHALG